MTPAERQRRYRRRINAGLMVVPVEIDADAISLLEAAELLKPENASNPQLVGVAVAKLISRYA